MTIIIPAYQPDKKLSALVREIKENSNYAVIIVDDGSSSGCGAIFAEARNEGCTVLVHGTNLGKGAALKTAFRYVLLQSSEKDGVVCADCDGQHSWEDIRKTAENVILHKNSIILGRREFTGPVPFRSLIGNTITRFVFSLVSGSNIRDTQTGLRGFPVKLLPWLTKVKGRRYEYEMNQLLEAKSSGCGLYEIPIRTIYDNRNKSSHFRPVRDSVKIYLPIIKFGLSSASCGIIDFGSLFLLNRLTDNLFVSVIAARAMSSLCNYILNKSLVFKASGRNGTKSLIKYYGLAAVILICNYLLLDLFANAAGIPLFWGKLLTEGLLFTISFHAQKRYVFVA